MFVPECVSRADDSFPILMRHDGHGVYVGVDVGMEVYIACLPGQLYCGERRQGSGEGAVRITCPPRSVGAAAYMDWMRLG